MRLLLPFLALTPLLPAQDESLDDLLARMDALTAELEALRALQGGAAPVGTTGAEERLARWADHQAMADRTPTADLEWRFLGPTNISGRVTDVAVPAPRGSTYRLYAATASGGVWRSDNDGTSWSPIFEDAPTASI